MYNLQTNKSVQTAFRFRPELLERVKAQARLEDMSLNAYVESILEASLAREEDVYERLYAQIEGMKPSANNPLVFPEPSAPISFTDEELAADSKLEYLVRKHLK